MANPLANDMAALSAEALVTRAEDRIRQMPLEDSQNAFIMADNITTVMDAIPTQIALAAVHLALAHLLVKGHAERQPTIMIPNGDGKLVLAGC